MTAAEQITAAVERIVAEQAERLEPVHTLSPAATAKSRDLARVFVTPINPKGD